MKKTVCVWMAVFLLLSACSSGANSEIIASGECGENVTWTLDSNGTLTISGAGPMEDYAGSTTPWFEDRDSITKAVIENGVTTIGNLAFDRCSSLTSVTIPDSVTSIGAFAFSRCNTLTSVTIPVSVTNIDGAAFSSAGFPSSLTDVYYGGSEAQWDQIAIGISNDMLRNAAIHYNS